MNDSNKAKVTPCDDIEDEEIKAIERGLADIEAGRFTESIEEAFEKAAELRNKKKCHIKRADGKVYEVLSVEKGWYRIVDESEDDYLYPPELFEIVEPNDGSTPVLNSSLSSEQVSIIRAKEPRKE